MSPRRIVALPYEAKVSNYEASGLQLWPVCQKAQDRLQVSLVHPELVQPMPEAELLLCVDGAQMELLGLLLVDLVEARSHFRHCKPKSSCAVCPISIAPNTYETAFKGCYILSKALRG